MNDIVLIRLCLSKNCDKNLSFYGLYVGILVFIKRRSNYLIGRIIGTELDFLFRLILGKFIFCICLFDSLFDLLILFKIININKLFINHSPI